MTPIIRGVAVRVGQTWVTEGLEMRIIVSISSMALGTTIIRTFISPVVGAKVFVTYTDKGTMIPISSSKYNLHCLLVQTIFKEEPKDSLNEQQILELEIKRIRTVPFRQRSFKDHETLAEYIGQSHKEE